MKMSVLIDFWLDVTISACHGLQIVFNLVVPLKPAAIHSPSPPTESTKSKDHGLR